jgi:catechol 2,3-dioxygenase-like lactoylglutathione lyase family enzyme
LLDHIGFPVSDYTRSKTFYEKALAPLGYALLMEVQQTENDHPAAGFGAVGKPDFWIGGEGGLNQCVHVAFATRDRASVDAFYRAAIAAGGRDNGGPGLRRLERGTRRPKTSLQRINALMKANRSALTRS